MDTIEITFQIVTPMFMGGAEKDSHEELRLPSIKGVLRFWFRAIFPNEDYGCEARIFGGSGRGEGQSKILLRLSEINCDHGEKDNKRWAENNSQIPYLGYGLIERKETDEINANTGKPIQKFITVRPYIMEKSTFKLTVIFKPHPDTEAENQQYMDDLLKVQRTLWAMTMFGGLGARSRKGFGSLTVLEATGMTGEGLPSLMPENESELKEIISDFISSIQLATSSLPDKPAEHTCFSTDFRCIVAGKKTTPMLSLEWLGKTIQKHRSFRGAEPYDIAKKDHDLMKGFIVDGDIPAQPPQRAAFGLPHNYFFSTEKKGGIDLMENGKKGRRASPLFFSIHDFSNQAQPNAACVVVTFLPARLIPVGREVILSGDNRKPKKLPLANDFTAITDLLDLMNGQEVLVNE